MASKSAQKKVKREAEKVAKKSPVAVLVAVICLVVFIGAGFLTGFLITKNDSFKLNNDNKELPLAIGSSYVEEGATVTAYGKDLSDLLNVIIYDSEGEKVVAVDTSIDNEFYIVYTLKEYSPSGLFEKLAYNKYKDYKQVRHVIVGEGVNE